MAPSQPENHSQRLPHSLFRTYELLEHLLHFLDHASLRQARLVNTSWHSIISKNTILCRTWRQRLRLRDLKILLLGASNVGKGSLIKKCCHNSAGSPRYRHSIVRLPETDGEIWMARMYAFEGDTYELDRSDALDGLLSNGVQAIVLVYEVGSRLSIDMARAWAERMRRDGTEVRGWSGAVLIALLAAKCDLSAQAREVEQWEGIALAQELGVPFWESSSEADEPGVAQPLQGFFKSYRDVKMREKVERQVRVEMPAEGLRQEPAHVQRDESAASEERQSWWRRSLIRPTEETKEGAASGRRQSVLEILSRYSAQIHK